MTIRNVWELEAVTCPHTLKQIKGTTAQFGTSTHIFFIVCYSQLIHIKMKVIKHIWNIIGALLGVAVNLEITYDFLIENKEPSNYLVYIALLLYMQMFLKHKDKSE